MGGSKLRGGGRESKLRGRGGGVQAEVVGGRGDPRRGRNKGERRNYEATEALAEVKAFSSC